jgi:hypothetical protein
VALFNAWDAPVVLQAKQLVPARVWSAALGLALTMGLAPLARASHPPAGATTLLVALGSLRTPADALSVMIGATLLGALGEGLRRLRLQRAPGGVSAQAGEQVTAPGARLPAGSR